MLPEISTVDVYTDFQGLGRLRAQAQARSPGALQEVARQFEGLMLQMMLKSMRQANLGVGLLENDQSQLYRDLYDQQLAVHLAGKSGLGLAEVLARQLGGAPSSSPGEPVERGIAYYRAHPAATAVSVQAPAHKTGRSDAAEVVATPAPPRAVSGAEVAAVDGPTPIELSESTTPQEFVERLWPLAQGAAERLGVAPEVLLAQAALETGWGAQVIRRRDGSSSHNLFGIKADRRWVGDRVAVPTLEYENGAAVRRHAEFRAYGSFHESLRDYVDFLQSSPRYGAALAVTADAEAYVRGLQEAGYATDPGYADKIISILSGDTMRKVEQFNNERT